MDNEKIVSLIEVAIGAREMAYVPYSGFRVGAALMTKDGQVFPGCNIENAAFSPTNCAERTAFFSAIAAGNRDFAVIVVVGGPGDLLIKNCFPCGVCLQVMAEFCREDFRIIIAESPKHWRKFALSDLLPFSFKL
ncbi:MAG: cytidine deaminase [Clostridiales bacterium]|jgi:cytidine deaminase|nr:cytidine deaminase [Clostridiales bacterium]